MGFTNSPAGFTPITVPQVSIFQSAENGANATNTSVTLTNVVAGDTFLVAAVSNQTSGPNAFTTNAPAGALSGFTSLADFNLTGGRLSVSVVTATAAIASLTITATNASAGKMLLSVSELVAAVRELQVSTNVAVASPIAFNALRVSAAGTLAFLVVANIGVTPTIPTITTPAGWTLVQSQTPAGTFIAFAVFAQTGLSASVPQGTVAMTGVVGAGLVEGIVQNQ